MAANRVALGFGVGMKISCEVFEQVFPDVNSLTQSVNQLTFRCST
jgi:hypothetical protein